MLPSTIAGIGVPAELDQRQRYREGATTAGWHIVVDEIALAEK